MRSVSRRGAAVAVLAVILSAGEAQAGPRGEALYLQHCAACHGTTSPAGGLDLTAFSDETRALASPKVWRRVADRIEIVAAGSAAVFEADRPHAYVGRGPGATAFTMVVEEPEAPRGR